MTECWMNKRIGKCLETGCPDLIEVPRYFAEGLRKSTKGLNQNRRHSAGDKCRVLPRTQIWKVAVKAVIWLALSQCMMRLDVNRPIRLRCPGRNDLNTTVDNITEMNTRKLP
jgi:hypothetical protein